MDVHRSAVCVHTIVLLIAGLVHVKVVCANIKSISAFNRPVRNCAIITWGGGGGIRENDNKREGGLDTRFNTYRGEALLFHSFLQTGKAVEGLLEYYINTKNGIKLTNSSTLRCSDL